MTLTFLLSSMRRHFWVVALVAVLGLGAGIALPFVRESVYTAEATLLLEAPASGGFQDSDNFVAAQLAFLSSTALVEEVAAAFPGETPRSIRTSVTVALQPPSTVTISAISTDAQRAAELANTYAQSYLLDQRERLTSRAQADLESVEAQIAELDAQTATLNAQLLQRPTDAALITQINALEERKSRLFDRRDELEGAIEQSIASELTAPAEVPKTRTGLSPWEWAAVGLIGGIFGGAGLASLFAAVSGKLLDARQLEELLGVPVVARIPVVPELAKGPEAGLDMLPAKLATRLDRLCVRAEGVGPADGRQLRVAVVGTSSGTGVTTLALMLGARLAQSRMSVGIVDADGLDPWISRRLSRSQAKGGEPAAGWGSNGTRRRETEGDRPTRTRNAPRGRSAVEASERAGGAPSVAAPLRPTAVATAHEGLVVLGNGPRADQMVQAAGVDEVLAALSGTDTDIVVFDGGSVMDAALAVRLVQQVDVVVLAVPLSNQPVDQIRVVRRLFEGRPVEVLPVITDVAPRRRRSE